MEITKRICPKNSDRTFDKIMEKLHEMAYLHVFVFAQPGA